MTDVVDPISPLPPPLAKKNNTLLIVIGVIVLLCCCCFGALGLLLAFGPPFLDELGFHLLAPILAALP